VIPWIAAAFHIARRLERGESVWLIQDSEVELAKACAIGDYFDLRDFAIGNSEAEYAREMAGGGQDEPHLAIDKRWLYEASHLREGDGTPGPVLCAANPTLASGVIHLLGPRATCIGGDDCHVHSSLDFGEEQAQIGN
jgi:hypothetical protein